MRSKPIQTFLAIFLPAFVASVIVNPKARPTRYYQNAPKPLVIARQGGDGVCPGGTMFAFENAVQSGADVLETRRGWYHYRQARPVGRSAGKIKSRLE